MKKLLIVLLLLICAGLFIAQDTLKPALVVVKVKFKDVKQLSAFKEEIQKVADKYNLIIEDVNFKSLK